MEFGSFMEFHLREGYTQADAFDEAFEHVDMAEELGIDAVWMAESHFNPDRAVLSSPMVVGTAIAARTKRLKVGTAVQVLPLGNPIRIAEETATLDQISKGRLEFGVGRSGLPGAYEGYNFNYGESRERFYEYLDIIVQAWTNERFSYEGKFHSYNNVCLVPKPYQKPHPPLRMAANTPDTFPKVGKMNLPVFVGVRQLDVARVAQLVDTYQKARDEAGHEGPPDVSLRVPVYVSDTWEDAWSTPQASFMKQFQRLGRQLSTSVGRSGTNAGEERAERGGELASLTWDKVIGTKTAVGTPEMVIKQLQAMKDTLQLTGVVAEFNAGELIPRDKLARSFQLFCEKVIPAFK
jgi:alkanesulfonate monooxygenase SsuD/methylene tetrahydromethanopterin reductase-like flavin-dependent oxidoreductase (luciferase family)